MGAYRYIQRLSARAGAFSRKIWSSLAARVAAIYASVGALWIVVSDRFLEALGVDPHALTRLQTFKGALYVAITAALLYWLVARGTDALLRLNRDLIESRTVATRINRVYRVLSGINSVILRSDEREPLLQETCRIAHEEGGFRFVWIGLRARDEIFPRLAAHAGEGLTHLQATLADARTRREVDLLDPPFRATRERRAFVVNDIEQEPSSPWRDQAIRDGFRAIAAFPFDAGNGVTGILALYSGAADVFSPEEVRLLKAVAADVGLGLRYINQERQLYRVANYDPLTNLPNRRLFEDRLTQAIARARSDQRHIGVMVLGLPQLRRLSDVVGQGAGDQLVQRFAKHLSNVIRAGDSVTRLAHDEFGVMLAQVAEVQDVGNVARKILEPFETVSPLLPGGVRLRPVAGIAIYPSDGDKADTLLRHAALALHGAGEGGGRPYVFYSKKIDTEVRYRQRLEQELNQSLARNEMELRFQPIVETSSRRVLGAEALARWTSRSLGAIAPGTFIPVAEQTGFVIPLGQWALDRACRQLAAWRRLGFDSLYLSVNVSARQLREVDFIAGLHEAISRAGLAGDRLPLALEVTESIFIDDIQTASDVLSEARELGVKVYMDDFGTGYSSLRYLHTLPVDALKIDRAFIEALGTDPDAEALVKAIIALAAALGAQVIAEGVESEQQLAALRDLNCPNAQGYLFGPALALSDFEPRLRGAA